MALCCPIHRRRPSSPQAPKPHAQWRLYQQVRSQELRPGGASLAVTNANRLQYCYLLAHWHLHGRLGASAAAFASGLAQVRIGAS